jgi:hypothetical protein
MLCRGWRTKTTTCSGYLRQVNIPFKVIITDLLGLDSPSCNTAVSKPLM